MSDNAPSATTNIDEFRDAAKQGHVLTDFPILEDLVLALQKLQAQIDDLQAQINAL